MSAIAAALSNLDEGRLVRRAIRGDMTALDALFARHNRALYQTALRVLGNAEDAEDALQEGLLSAYRNLPRFEGRSQFSTWLTRIVINAALMRLRSRRSRPAVSLENWTDEEHNSLPPEERFAAEGPSPEDVCVGRELRDLLEENLGELSPLLRSAFLLREGQGLSTSEAARKLGVSENTLKARLWRARQQLAERLAPALGLRRNGGRAPQGSPEFAFAGGD